MFSCKYCEVFKNNFFEEHLRWLLLDTPHLPVLLIKNRNKKGKTLDLPSILISFSNTRNKNVNSSTRLAGLTRVTNSWAVTNKSWSARCSTHAQGFSRSKLHHCMHFQDRNFLYMLPRVISCGHMLDIITCGRILQHATTHYNIIITLINCWNLLPLAMIYTNGK